LAASKLMNVLTGVLRRDEELLGAALGKAQHLIQQIGRRHTDGILLDVLLSRLDPQAPKSRL